MTGESGGAGVPLPYFIIPLLRDERKLVGPEDVCVGLASTNGTADDTDNSTDAADCSGSIEAPEGRIEIGVFCCGCSIERRALDCHRGAYAAMKFTNIEKP